MISFFMGANTCRGFCSLFDTLGGDVSVIKGYSGSGKSTLLKSLCGEGCERILCSADSGSLDGVIRGNRAVLDGTAPHVFEPAGDGKYIVMPQPELFDLKDGIGKLRAEIKADYGNAYALISAANDARRAAREMMLACFNGDRFLKRADGILKREKNAPGSLKYRFCDALCADGAVCLEDTVDSLATRVIAVEDSFGLAEGFFSVLAEGFSGTDAYVCLSPLDPDKVRHIILPRLSLAFVTSDEIHVFKGRATRTVHEKVYIDKAALARRSFEIKLLKNLELSLLSSAFRFLAAAKEKHMKLEALIRPRLDTDAINGLISSLNGSF